MGLSSPYCYTLSEKIIEEEKTIAKGKGVDPLTNHFQDLQTTIHSQELIEGLISVSSQQMDSI